MIRIFGKRLEAPEITYGPLEINLRTIDADSHYNAIKEMDAGRIAEENRTYRSRPDLCPRFPHRR